MVIKLLYYACREVKRQQYYGYTGSNRILCFQSSNSDLEIGNVLQAVMVPASLLCIDSPLFSTICGIHYIQIQQTKISTHRASPPKHGLKQVGTQCWEAHLVVLTCILLDSDIVLNHSYHKKGGEKFAVEET